MDKPMTERIERLEISVAHLTRLTDELSDVIAQQDKTMDLLTRRIEMLLRAAAEREAESSGGIAIVDQRPPHW